MRNLHLIQRDEPTARSQFHRDLARTLLDESMEHDKNSTPVDRAMVLRTIEKFMADLKNRGSIFIEPVIETASDGTMTITILDPNQLAAIAKAEGVDSYIKLSATVTRDGAVFDSLVKPYPAIDPSDMPVLESEFYNGC